MAALLDPVRTVAYPVPMLRQAFDTDFTALIAGQPPPGFRLAPGGLDSPAILAMLRALANTIRPKFAPAAWLVLEPGADLPEIVGLLSLVKAVADSAIDIGYGIAPTRQHHGHATAAVADLLVWARRRRDITRVRADTALSNGASQGVLTRNGFVETGRRIDVEDGPMICWQAEVGH